MNTYEDHWFDALVHVIEPIFRYLHEHPEFEVPDELLMLLKELDEFIGKGK